MTLSRWVGAAALVTALGAVGCSGSTSSSSTTTSTTVVPAKQSKHGGTGPVDVDRAPDNPVKPK